MKTTISLQKSESKIHPISNGIPPLNIVITPDEPYKATEEDDLFLRIKGLLVLGRFLGLIPCQGIFQKDFNRFRFRRFGFWVWVNATILIMLAVNASVCFIGMCRVKKRNAAELASSSSAFIYYSNGTFIYAYFLRNASEFTKLFSEWSKLNLYFGLKDKTLSRDTGIIVTIVFASAVLENAVLQLIDFPAFENNQTGIISALETYYMRAHGYWWDLIPFHWLLSIFAFLTNKLALYGWNFIDILIAVFSRALSAKFRLLNDAAVERIPTMTFDCLETSKNGDGQSWINLVRDHTAICNLLSVFEDFLSPLVFCSFAVNIYFTCLQLLIGLSPSQRETEDPDSIKSKLYAVYATWSFIHLIFRLYVVSISAANINVYAHGISRSLKRCPIQYYSVEVERIERKVNTGPDIGLNGLGCFIVTKPFILSIIGVVFTFEIVLLQAVPQSSCPK